ncbi:26S proteasome non-ATPase regulatory subunit 9-like [Acanthaster planci]|uniref:26S proteasome non-ATPase regulatory subunit 9 n=1 Tax=Acanthaster planci TaxID=133434 RepID=A0A8B7Y0R0_ACAPL|nr:26S proteasome non-ATPase regulatory subunit 9-like [Acanthaster planci]
MAASRRQKVQELMDEKDSIEKEIKELFEVLESQGNVGMHGPLIDPEGYPRSDIDVYSVRTARHRIICLQNDHKALMVQIESSLHDLHAFERQQREQGGSLPTNGAGSAAAALVPFARIDLVTEGSPAANAGLLVGDEIIEFGHVNTSNFKSMQDVAAVVQQNEGKLLTIVMLREGQGVQLSLKPQTWSGRGLLGCNIVPIKK